MREWLRALPTFDAPPPPFDPVQAPDDPIVLFTQWLQDAAQKVPMPHAAVLATADGDGVVSARTLILKDLDADGWVFATQSDSPKARDLAANPHAALTFFWSPLGRQVRVQGRVEQEGPAEAAADFLARPTASRAACLVGHSSEPLGSLEEYRAAFASAHVRVEAEPELVAQHWATYRIRAAWVEFWQSTDSGQVRVRYEPDGEGWRHGLRWP